MCESSWWVALLQIVLLQSGNKLNQNRIGADAAAIACPSSNVATYVSTIQVQPKTHTEEEKTRRAETRMKNRFMGTFWGTWTTRTPKKSQITQSGKYS